MLSPDFQRIKLIRDYCTRIGTTIDRFGNSFSTFETDYDYQQTVSFSILQIGELSGGLSEEFRKQTAHRVQWGPMRGTRNLVVHNYGNINREVVWETATTDIPQLKNFCDELLKESD